MSRGNQKNPEMLIGALLRVPSQAIHRRLIRDLNEAGFLELRLPHIAVFQYPGPEGARPGVLAERAGISKQAMNQLLSSLEEHGYLVRSGSKKEGRARIVRLTERGHGVNARILDVLRTIEREWREELGAETFAELKRLLLRVWGSPSLVGTSQPLPIRPA